MCLSAKRSSSQVRRSTFSSLETTLLSSQLSWTSAVSISFISVSRETFSAWLSTEWTCSVVGWVSVSYSASTSSDDWWFLTTSNTEISSRGISFETISVLDSPSVTSSHWPCSKDSSSTSSVSILMMFASWMAVTFAWILGEVMSSRMSSFTFSSSSVTINHFTSSTITALNSCTSLLSSSNLLMLVSSAKWYKFNFDPNFIYGSLSKWSALTLIHCYRNKWYSKWIFLPKKNRSSYLDYLCSFSRSLLSHHWKGKKSVVFFIRFSSFTFVYIFTSTRKRSQLFFVRLRSFTFPPSPLLPSQSLPSPLLPSTLGLRLHPWNKSLRPASIILLSEVLHFVSIFLQAT